ncbi:Nitrous oxide reductase maturation protein, outer-membrane lipoprotein NosL [hydrothermal vent metagenome]|uniref:Nitrous oxide reductase maturation protein, outer-membrane lipoprotein NosL n=1 Tax=hydrothermal vent metagenome TaxID=652676 RepID=A0A1W1BHA8_9ZZZZ
MLNRKMTIITMLLTLLLSTIYAGDTFSKVASIEPTLTQKGASKKWCSICGMNIKMFYKTSHTSKLPNGTDRQYCSIRCLVVDMQKHKIDLADIKVVDVNSQKLIDANRAFYVIGSDIKGTMAKISKLAFATKDEAEKFAKEHGGEVTDFATVLKRAKESLKSDIAMINMKKKKMMHPMGAKLFKKKCQQTINPTDFVAINALKSAIVENKLCKPLKEKQLQAVALYLWDVKRTENLDKVTNKIEVTNTQKCPVCGMFVYKYPKWVAQIFYKDGKDEHYYSFDGVKDLMKFYFDPMRWGKYATFKKENITKILVTDYYSQKVIDGTKAYFVIGSDVLGPMGNELIPFEQEADAKTFYADHNGKSIVRFDKIVEKEVLKLDE